MRNEVLKKISEMVAREVLKLSMKLMEGQFQKSITPDEEFELMHTIGMLTAINAIACTDLNDTMEDVTKIVIDKAIIEDTGKEIFKDGALKEFLDRCSGEDPEDPTDNKSIL